MIVMLITLTDSQILRHHRLYYLERTDEQQEEIEDQQIQLIVLQVEQEQRHQEFQERVRQGHRHQEQVRHLQHRGQDRQLRNQVHQDNPIRHEIMVYIAS